MGKAAVIATIGIGGTGFAVGGIYLSGLFSAMDASLPESKDKLKEYGDKGCIGYLFPKVNLGAEVTTSSTTKIDKNTFNEVSKPGASCLTVNWEKKTYSAEKNPWTGSFRWLWGFVQGEKGFIIFATATPSDTEKQLDLSGVVYLLKQEANKGWTVEWKKDMAADKKISKEEFENVFPKVGTVLKENQAAKLTDDHWGFVSGKDDMDNVCKKGEEGECKGSPKTESSFMGLWLMKGFDEKQKGEVKKWSESTDTVLSKLFNSSELDLTDGLKTQKGEWRVKVLVQQTTPPEEKTTSTTKA